MFITHDLDESIRIGNRIATMKDGKTVQIDTPEEIILNPVDEYVSDFVAGISKLHLIFAHCVMIPMDRYKAEHGELPADAREAVPDMDLSTLMDLCAEGSGVLKVMADGIPVGAINRAGLLRAIRESQG